MSTQDKLAMAVDTLRPEVREAVFEIDACPFECRHNVRDWKIIRAELLRLTGENMELRGANKRMKFLLDSAEAEIAALKARIADAPYAVVNRCALNSAPEYDVRSPGSSLDGKRVRLVVEE